MVHNEKRPADWTAGQRNNGRVIMTSNLQKIKQLNKAKEKTAKKVAKWKAKKYGAEHQRLPHGSVFNVTYSALSTSWTGSLAIPGCPIFEGCQSGVYQLLTRLDALYRAHLKREGA